MKKTSPAILINSLFILLFGTVSGWAIVCKFSGDVNGNKFFFLSLIVSLIIYFFQITLFLMSLKKISLRIAFSALLGLSIMWFVLNFCFPIFLMTEIDPTWKVAVFFISLVLYFMRWREGVTYFDKKWDEKKLTIVKYYDSKGNRLDWQGFIGSLKLSFAVFPAWIPKVIGDALSLIMVFSILTALNLRSVFPIFSIFAWTIPCVIVSSFFVQIISVNFRQFLKVRTLETTMGMKISSIIV